MQNTANAAAIDTAIDPREPGSGMEDWSMKVLAERVDENLQRVMSLAILMASPDDPARDPHMCNAAEIIQDLADQAREMQGELLGRL